MSDIPTFWYSLADAERSKPMHVVLTAQTKVTEDEVNNQTTRTIDVQRGAQSITLASPDSVMCCETETDVAHTDDEGQTAERTAARFGKDTETLHKARVSARMTSRDRSVTAP